MSRALHGMHHEGIWNIEFARLVDEVCAVGKERFKAIVVLKK